MRKTIFFITSVLALTLIFLPKEAFADNGKYHKTRNYELAERFSTKKIYQMVKSTRVRPNWFVNSEKFWYQWSDTQGTHYYIVDAKSGKKTEVFDMARLAMELTLIVKDPFDAKHIPIRKFKLKDDKYFTFDIESSQWEDKPSVKDTTKKKVAKKNEPRKKKVFHFQWNIATKELEDVSKDYEEEKYPRWASVSPNGELGVYVKNHNLYFMNKEDLLKAQKDDKDSTLVEHALTTDGTSDFSYNTDNYKGDNDTSATKRVFPYGVKWSPDSKHFAAMRWDMSMVKDFWVIHSIAHPRPTLETYKYQMPGEDGPKGYLYIYNVEDGSLDF